MNWTRILFLPALELAKAIAVAATMTLTLSPSAHAQDAQFDVFEFRVEGTTLLPAATVEKAVYGHLGEKKTIADVEQAREALEAAYHAAGYLTVLVSIPQQKVDAGVVRLQVTEAPVERLRVVESRYFSLGAIKAGVPELAEGHVPNFPQMQDELAALNRNGDRRISPVLRPGRVPGTVEVDLKVEDKLPLHGSVDLNNRYSPDTTPTRMNASLRWDNLWEMQHSLGLTLQTVPENPNENRVLSANYSIPLPSGNYLAFYGVNSDSDVSPEGTLNVLGKGSILGARYILPLRGEADFFHTATLGVDYKDFRQSVNLVGSGGFNTPITYIPFTLGWDGNWLGTKTLWGKSAGNGERGSERNTKLGISANFDVRGLINNEQQFADKRYKGRPGYFFLRGSASNSDKASGNGWDLGGRLNWQYAFEPLISNEQFTVGGVETVRGYLESAASGDSGIVGTVELSTPNFAPQLGASAGDARLVAFYDAASVSVLSPLTAQDQFTLSGAGLGLRLKAPGGASAAMDWAVALEDLGKIKRGDSAFYFKLAYDW
jgi:hemolysin activation/secretion protein